MRAGLSTIQQTLMPDAAAVLSQSIAEASRRNHGQTTPLHVAATLLASPSGFLRQACIRSHPNSSHPLQCRALDLCFSVALERLPTAQAAPAPGTEPPVSNALMAALKRAQANQRRGCPEQQQQPLLAVKVELDQLIASILDDPSVSRVMREAGFSSPAVKATIEQSVNSLTLYNHHQPMNPNFGGIGPPILSNPGQLITPFVQSQSPSSIPAANRNVYLNQRLQQGRMESCRDELRKVLEIMTRMSKRNPVLVGDSDPVAVVKEFLRKLENKELETDQNLKNVEVISMERDLFSDKDRISEKINELEGAITSRIRSGGVILDLGDLKWLVEQPVSFCGVQRQQHHQPVVAEMGRVAVVEMAKLLGRFRGGDSGQDSKLWLVGTATCETYLRCQVYHPTMENDWDLQAVPMASRSPLPGMFSRFGSERLLSNLVDPLNPLQSVPTPRPSLTSRASENSDPGQRPSFCPHCTESYEKELAKLSVIKKSFFEAQQDATRPSLPRWLQNVNLHSTTDAKMMDQSQSKTQELQKKWRDMCLHLHPNYHRQYSYSDWPSPTLSTSSLCDPMVPSSFQVSKPLGQAFQLNINQACCLPAMVTSSSPPTSSVRTDLVLGREGAENGPNRVTEDEAKDFMGCMSSEPQTKSLDKFANALDSDPYKKLLKALMEKAWWQGEAASAVASAVTRCRLGRGKRMGAGSRGDIWLLFAGPDRVGKKKMATVLAEQICGGNLIMTVIGTHWDEEVSDVNLHGKTAIDRIAESVQKNPFSVIMLQDIDQADVLVRGNIKCAIESGRLADSHGREVSLGNAIFILTGDWSTTNRETQFVDEKKHASISSGNWQLGLIIRDKKTKRRVSWSQDDNSRLSKPWKVAGSGLSLDLNLAAADEDDKTDGSHNSSDLTVDHEDELNLIDSHFITSVPNDLLSSVDDSIMFKPVDCVSIQREIKKMICMKFSMIVNDNVSLEVDDDVLDKILGGLWHDRTSLGAWIENVLVPGFDRLKPQISSGDRTTLAVRLVIESGSGCHGANADWLPCSILV